MTTPSENIVYCSGPMFSPGDLWEMKNIADGLEQAGYRTYLPQRDGIEVGDVMKLANQPGQVKVPEALEQKVMDLVRKAVFSLDMVQLLERCSCTVFNMNGRVPDGGSISETAAAFTSGKPVVIYKNDPITILMGTDNPLIEGLSYNWDYADSVEEIPKKLTDFLNTFEKKWGLDSGPALSPFLVGVTQLGWKVWERLEEIRQKGGDPLDELKQMIEWLLQNASAVEAVYDI